jgi:hypothetical protein
LVMIHIAWHIEKHQPTTHLLPLRQPQRPAIVTPQQSQHIFPANTSAAYAVQPVRSGVGAPTARLQLQLAGTSLKGFVEPLFAFPGRVETPWACCMPSSPVPGAWE